MDMARKRSFYERYIKRVLDIVCALAALLVFVWLYLLVAVLVRFKLGAPVLFVQPRPGKDEKIFKLYKFRTMTDAQDEHGELLPDEIRLTAFGRSLRATSLDELPEVFNILKGDMSIVGPRPERKCLADEISKEIPEFCYRLKVRGGLTGYAQIYGKYNTSAYDKLRLDMMYIENYSPLLDIRLIILTLRIIFSKDSTEGIDVAMENQRRADELWRELDEENEEKEKGGAE